jgi:hypothetical protein
MPQRFVPAVPAALKMTGREAAASPFIFGFCVILTPTPVILTGGKPARMGISRRPAEPRTPLP